MPGKGGARSEYSRRQPKTWAAVCAGTWTAPERLSPAAPGANGASSKPYILAEANALPYVCLIPYNGLVILSSPCLE
jgi:hypothetical protein